MRKYLLPLTVCAAIGAILVVLIQLGDDPEPPPRDEPEQEPVFREEPEAAPFGEPARTRTSLREHRYLRELERALARDDLKRVGFFRQKVCEDIEQIERNETLTGNLLQLIRENGVEADDPRRREWVLPILRVLKHPEATKLIETAYYGARDEQEKLVLLEAMSHSYHDPQAASTWAKELALNAESEEHRHRAFEVVERFSENDEVVAETAIAIYGASTRPEQRFQMMEALSWRAAEVNRAADFLRERMRNPEPQEIPQIVTRIETWGTEQDARRLDELAEEYPSQGREIRERAGAIRRMIRERAGLLTEEERLREEEEERAREEERLRQEGKLPPEEPQPPPPPEDNRPPDDR